MTRNEMIKRLLEMDLVAQRVTIYIDGINYYFNQNGNEERDFHPYIIGDFEEQPDEDDLDFILE